MLLALALAGTAAATPAKHLPMRLVVEGGAAQPGKPLVLAVETRPEPGWHGYWLNPGDAGFAPSFDWTLPEGGSVAEWQYPVPTTLTVAGIMNYVYEAPYAPVVTLHLPAMPAGTRVPIRAHARYLVCTTSICVPEEQDLALDTVVGGGTGGNDAAFDRFRAALPRPLGGTATYQAEGDAVRISVPFPAGATLQQAYFFPARPGLIDQAAPQAVTRDGDRLVIATRAAPNGRRAGPIEGVLRIGANQGLSVRAMPGIVPAPRETGLWWAALAAFAGAVLGGLILNIMPCVFPILSLKALSLARGGVGAREARGEALAYTAGVVLVCVALGAAILVLRAAGASVGWAFQLQHPATIFVLLLLSVAITLNLLGAFELPTPRFAGGQGGAFATGALAAFVATPCTGPFMATALGAALILPWPAALGVFAGLGIGLALPFLAIGFVPALRKRLPRPGAWMVTMRRVLAVPMALTAAALVWLLWRSLDPTMLAYVGAGVAILLVALIAGGRRQAGGRSFGAGPVAAAVAALAVIVPLHGATSLSTGVPIGAERFSEARLAALRAQGRPVFAYFTADWCLTCKVNEKAAIETAAVRSAFRQHGVAVLVGDWTDGDPTLGRFIQAHNRAGVPLYLFYPARGAEPQTLPQLLTPGMLEALGG